MAAKKTGPGSPKRAERQFDAVEALLRVSELALRRRSQLARDVGLSDPQWRALEQIHSEDFMPSLFARGAETSPAAVSRTLRQLQELGLVTAAIGSEDGRQREYRTTAKGRRVIARLRAARERALAAIWEEFAEVDLQRFSVFATQLADRLEAYSAE